MLFMWWQSCSCHSCEGNVTITIHTIAPIHQSLYNYWDPNHSTSRLFNAVISKTNYFAMSLSLDGERTSGKDVRTQNSAYWACGL